MLARALHDASYGGFSGVISKQTLVGASIDRKRDRFAPLKRLKHHGIVGQVFWALWGLLPPWGKDFDLVWAATKAFFDADGEQPVYIGRPDSILSMDESVVQVAQILGAFGDKTVGFFGMGSSPPRMYYYSSF